MIEARDFTNPRSLAIHLSKYVTCPSTIVAGTANHFGKARAISLDQATRLVMAERKARERLKKIAEHKGKDDGHLDGEDYRPRGLVKVTPLALRPRDTTPAPTPCQSRNTGKMWPDWYNPRARKQIPSELIKAVGIDAGFNYQQMIGGGRNGQFIAARSVVCKILRERGLSYPQIGRFLGKRDHSTVINAVAKFDYYCERYPGTQELYERHRDATDEG